MNPRCGRLQQLRVDGCPFTRALPSRSSCTELSFRFFFRREAKGKKTSALLNLCPSLLMSGQHSQISFPSDLCAHPNPKGNFSAGLYARAGIPRAAPTSPTSPSAYLDRRANPSEIRKSSILSNHGTCHYEIRSREIWRAFFLESHPHIDIFCLVFLDLTSSASTQLGPFFRCI